MSSRPPVPSAAPAPFTGQLYNRSATLLLFPNELTPEEEAGLVGIDAGAPTPPPSALTPFDLSMMHFRFSIRQGDVPTPNNAVIRVYNLSRDTVAAITAQTPGPEYNRVSLQAGYVGNNPAIIFQGTIKQFRVGHENLTDSYLDILAADCDEAYTYGFVNANLAASINTARQRVSVLVNGMNMGTQQQVDGSFAQSVLPTGGVLPRGRVLFGMSRDGLNCVAASQKMSWSIQNGRLQMIPLTGYLSDVPIEISSATGLIGYPEATDEGLKVRTLLNPQIQVGQRIHLNNTPINGVNVNGAPSVDVNKLIAQKANFANIPFDQWSGIQYVANVTSDGIYRVYVIDHTGDTRGNEWYTDMVCLSVDTSANPPVVRAG